MELVAEPIDIGTRTPTVLLNSADAAELGVHPLDRVHIEDDGTTVVGIVEITDELVASGRLGVTRTLGHVDGPVSVTIAPRPDSASFIQKKLADVELEHDEIAAVVDDIDRGRLSDVELSSFVTAIYTNGLSREEIRCLATCMVEVGESLSWDRPVVADKHSIGGVAGNRVTPIVVPIVAATGVTIPKTSSRAVTSAAGTADTLEVFCDVEFTLDEIREVVEATNGCMVWGGAMSLSPVDDKIIRVETPLSLDPPGQVVASVLSKKKSAGSTRVVIDVPYGEGAKVSTLAAARELAEDFRSVGANLGMTVECAITRGEQPIGRGIGPVLEARDVLTVLQGGGPEELRVKSVRLADMLLDACDVDADAATVLEDGRALAKFREIVAAQRGDPDVDLDDLVPASHTATVTTSTGGVVRHVDNRLLNELARRAGAPRDRAAGVVVSVRVGDEVTAGDDLLTVHARKAAKLDQAETYLAGNPPIRINEVNEALVERY